MIQVGSLALNAYNANSIPQVINMHMPRISSQIEDENKRKGEEEEEEKNLVLSARNASPTPHIFGKYMPRILKLHWRRE